MQEILEKAKKLGLNLKPIKIEELYEKLLDSRVNFAYVKKDGSVRFANGTLCGSLIPEEQIPEEKPEKSFKNYRYFDLTSKA
jgi:hypothetical protein